MNAFALVAAGVALVLLGAALSSAARNKKSLSELTDLLERDGNRHSFSKVTSFGAQVLVGILVAIVLLRGGHFEAWDVAALGVIVLTPHAYGVAKTAMRLKWERPSSTP